MIILGIILAGGAAPAATAPAALWNFYRQHDYFALRDALPPSKSGEPDEIAFLRAASLAAFDKTRASADILAGLLAHPLPGRMLVLEVRELLMLDRRAMFQYAAALDAVAPVLTADTSDSRVNDLDNRARLLRAIKDVPPQTVRSGNGGPIALDSAGRMRVAVNGQIVRMQIDTGANLSVMSRSTARALGLRVRAASYAISSSLGGRTDADVAVADLSLDDGTQVKNAVFLVLPDTALPVAGLIGFPVIAALGSVTYEGGSIMLGQANRAGGASTALALSGNDPLLQVGYNGHNILCRLDTGSGRSVFYEPFFRMFHNDFAPAQDHTVRIGSATGTHRRDTRVIPFLSINVAGKPIRLSNATVLTEPVRGNTYLYCNLGRDVLRRAPWYRIDFENMTLTLGG